MKRRISMAGRAIRVILIAGAMVFGAREAFASTREASRFTCANGHCSTQAECDACCWLIGSPGGTCTLSGACLCR
jgi:hypothetical protein